MRIKRLEIIGFKSFCDRTVVHFDEPITGIVGPNGCGKSNIVDAIRWCMGEQSAKHLRGKAMDDVIFNGSRVARPARHGRGHADLRQRRPACRSSTSPTPRSRSPAASTATATSEYFINKTPCRLRDITDFFLGTGVGTKAYSIIEQGRIGLIVSVAARGSPRRSSRRPPASPSSRRKKKAAEKKMEQTRQNLLRVSRHRRRAREAAGHAAAPGAEGRALPQVQGRAARHRAVEGVAPLARAARRGARRRPSAARGRRRAREARGRALVAREAAHRAERAELARRGAPARRRCRSALYELDNRIRLGEAEAELEAREAAELDARRAAARRPRSSELARAARARERRELGGARERARGVDARRRGRARDARCAREEALRRGEAAAAPTRAGASSTARAPSSRRARPRSRARGDELAALARRRDDGEPRSRAWRGEARDCASAPSELERARSAARRRARRAAPAQARSRATQSAALEARVGELPRRRVARGEARSRRCAPSCTGGARASRRSRRSRSATRASSAARARSCRQPSERALGHPRPGRRRRARAGRARGRGRGGARRSARRRARREPEVGVDGDRLLEATAEGRRAAFVPLEPRSPRGGSAPAIASARPSGVARARCSTSCKCRATEYAGGWPRRCSATRSWSTTCCDGARSCGARRRRGGTLVTLDGDVVDATAWSPAARATRRAPACSRRSARSASSRRSSPARARARRRRARGMQPRKTELRDAADGARGAAHATSTQGEMRS